MSGYPNPHRQHTAPDLSSAYPSYPPTRSASYNSQPGGDPGLAGIEHETAALTAHPDGFYGQTGWSSSQATLGNSGRVGFAEAPLLDRSGGPGAGGHHLLSARPSLNSQGSGRDSMVDWQERAKPLHRGATRKVKLTRKGHFVVEYPVPPAIVNSIEPHYKQASAAAGHGEEFTHLRYSAASCDPNDFTIANGWSLRPIKYNRETELMICCTSYNEDKKLFSRTMHSVMENVRDIVKSKSKFWNPKSGKEEGGARSGQGWEKIVVCCVADGIDPCDKGMLDVLATLGVYQDNIMKKEVDGKATVAHIFEYTTQISVDSKPSLVVPSKGNEAANMVPVQVILAIKQVNAKKINSHRWAFNAFAAQLQPEVCILIDVGTKPGHKSLYELWATFHNNKHCGGACGEIYVQTKGGKKLLNPLVAAQNFEYKMSNILDKPLESSFGFVSVLPGAFSAYRYRALQGRPLNEYFRGDATNPTSGSRGHDNMSIFEQNMYLAEDRILCFELMAKANARWILTYVKAAKGETDVPDSCPELIGQRRRWLNGSFAASVYSIIHFFRVYRSSHSIFRLFFLHVQMLFNVFVLVFTFFAPANQFNTFVIIIDLLPSQGTYCFYNEVITHWVNLALIWIYCAVLALQFILALGNRPKGEPFLYKVSFCVFAVSAYYLIVCAFILVVKAFQNIDFTSDPTVSDKILDMITGTNGVILAALASTFGVYIVSSLLYLDFWHMVTSFPQYIGVAPSLIMILNVYAFCNLHDVTWGTKEIAKAEALPSVKSSAQAGEKEAFIEEHHRTSEDLEATFKSTVRKALQPLKKDNAVQKPTQDDQNKTFRTRLVAVWLLCNGALVIAIQDASGLDTTATEQQAKTTIYFKIILWATAGLSLIRFIGCIWFLVTSGLWRCCRRT